MTDNRIFKLDLEPRSEIIGCTLETLAQFDFWALSALRGISAERLLRRVAVASPPSRRKDSNINKKALIAGGTLYLPIDIDGALFSVGDGNGAQGDSEVFITAIQ